LLLGLDAVIRAGVVGKRMQRCPVGRAGVEELALVPEMCVHRVTLDARPLRDRRDGRTRRAYARVQADGRLDDAVARLLEPFRAPLELVLPFHRTPVYRET
jgi:hypothetical protein